MTKLIVYALTIALTTSPVDSQVVAAVAGSQESGAVKQADLKIDVAFKQTPLDEAVRMISRESGIKIMFAPNLLPAKRVSYQLNKVTPAAALEQVLRGTGVSIQHTVDGSFKLIAAKPSSRSVVQGVVTGKVTDAKTGKGISGANISVGNDTHGVVTGEDGSYRLTNLPAGVTTITVHLVGYAKQSRSVTVGEGSTVAADFKLEPSANVLDQVIVTGTIIATELKAVPNAITVITAKQIEERGITRIDQLFRGEVPGLFSMNLGAQSGIGEVTMYSRGATALTNTSTGVTSFAGDFVATNPIKTYVDGVELADSRFLSQIDPRSIERIEILTGPQASTIYGSNALNGVMQIFTKRGASAKPQVELNLTSGLVQNNFSSATTPMHIYNGGLSGVEGRLSYNVGVSWDYMGAWTPAQQTQTIGGYGGSRFTWGKFSSDISARQVLTRDVARIVPQASRDFREEFGPAYFIPISVSGGGRNDQDAHTGTVSINTHYTPTSWWSHDLMFGRDSREIESLGHNVTFTNPGDTLLTFRHNSVNKQSESYAMTASLSTASLATISITSGIDHWRSYSSDITASGAILTGTLPSPTIVRDKPGKNTGGFMQGRLGIHDALFLTYGLRVEWNPNYGDDGQPNFASNYGIVYTGELGPVTAKLRGKYGRSTRPPAAGLTSPVSMESLGYTAEQLLEYNYLPFDYRLANPDLAPEFQQGGEGGVDLYFGSRASLGVTRYNQTVDGLISRVFPADSARSFAPSDFSDRAYPDGYGYIYQEEYLNVGSIRNQGWELQGNVNIGPFNTRGTYSWTKSRIIGITPRYRSVLTGSQFQVGSPFEFIPEHTWALIFSYAHLASTMSLAINGIGPLYTRDELSYLVSPSQVRVRANTSLRWDVPGTYRGMNDRYAMANFNVSHAFSSRVTAIMQVDNLTNFYTNDRDARYAVVGRQTRFGARVKW